MVTRQFDNQRLQSEEVAEFDYRPTACQNSYRMVVVRKNISVEKGEKVLFEDIRYFFYLTNEWGPEANEIVFAANDRCHQENLLAQLHSGVRALTAPLDNLESNWAYMVMTALAWNLKAWWALTLPESRAAGRQAPGRQAVGVGDRVQDVRERLRTSGVPDGADGSPGGVSVVAWNPYQLPVAVSVGRPFSLLSGADEVGVRTSRSATAPRAAPQKGGCSMINLTTRHKATASLKGIVRPISPNMFGSAGLGDLACLRTSP